MDYHECKAMFPNVAKLMEERLGDYGQVTEEIWLTKKTDFLLEAMVPLGRPLHLLEIKESSDGICLNTNIKEQNISFQPTWNSKMPALV